MIKSYPKILAAVGKYAEFIVGNDTIEITEKIDGSQFAFGKDIEGRLWMRSKGAIISYEDGVTDKLFKPAVIHVLSIQDLIPVGTCFYCETLCSPRHNTLAYNRIPKNHLILFGVTDFDRTIAEGHIALKEWAERLDIEVVPLIAEMKLSDLTQLKELLDRESVLGGPKIEGVVAKNYAKLVEFAGMVLPFAALKYVSEEFKEKHADNPDWIPQRNKVEDLLNRYKTEARWQKAVQHLREVGQISGEPKDIGSLMKELHRDLVEEEKENFKEELYDLYQKDWKATATAGFPYWYKDQLLSSKGG